MIDMNTLLEYAEATYTAKKAWHGHAKAMAMEVIESRKEIEKLRECLYSVARICAAVDSYAVVKIESEVNHTLDGK